LAAELEQVLKAEVQITPGSGGIYDVKDNGVLIFSKHELGRFPHDGEIMSIIQSVDAGIPLNDAKEKASAQAQQPQSFPSKVGEWLSNQLGGGRRD
jgi:predicted Rdx family selenoprotein